MRRAWQRLGALSLSLALVLLVSVPRPAQSQQLVLDLLNLAENTIAAIQAVLEVANQILELTALGELILGDGFDDDMSALGELIADGAGLAYDLSSIEAQINSLFALGSAPSGTRALRERINQIRQIKWQAHSYAMRTQTLLTTTQRAIQRLQRMVSTILDYVGNQQANQTISQIDTTISEQLAKLQVHTAAWQRSESLERMEQQLVMESLQNIDEAIMADWPE